jgi:hypothetical protein
MSGNWKTFAEWLADNPPPDLQALAEHYHGLGNVPEAVMQTFEAQRAEWEARRKVRHFDALRQTKVQKYLDRVAAANAELEAREDD